MTKSAIVLGAPYEAPTEYDTLPAMFEHVVSQYPGQGVCFIDSTGKENFICHSVLRHRALCRLTSLRRLGLKQGDQLLIEIPDPETFFVSFWACVLGGIVAIPINHPSSWSPDSDKLIKLANVSDILAYPKALVAKEHLHHYRKLQSHPRFQACHFIAVTADTEEAAEPAAVIDTMDSVIVQFSSGSTGISKGVVLNHKNVLMNSTITARHFGLCASETVFSWMPHTHDMGLFCQYLASFIAGCTVYIMTPQTFIRSPSLFLQKASKYRASWFGSPNFGIDWMVRKVPQRDLARIDLSSLRFILNGAEPISTRVIDAFAEKFGECGFKPSMMRPAYGLAESTAVATVMPPNTAPIRHHIDRLALIRQQRAVPIDDKASDAVEFICEGAPLQGVDLRIASVDGQVLDEQMVGEIQLRSQEVTSGYINNPQASADLFQAGWLRTGDLGYLSQGQLFVTGRKKDIVFINGLNYFAHDIEERVFDASLVVRGDLMVVGCYDPRLQQEVVLAFIKYRSNVHLFVPIANDVRQVVQVKLGIALTQIIPVKTIPKTTSGKLQRFVLSQSYLAGDFDDVICQVQAAEKIASVAATPNQCNDNYCPLLCEAWSSALSIPVEQLSLDSHFRQLGGNSIKAYDMLGRFEKRLGRSIGTDILTHCQTLQEMVTYLENDTGQGMVGQPAEASGNHPVSVAITGMSLQLPGAKDKQSFWQNLCAGKDAIDTVSRQRRELAQQAHWRDWMGELADIDQFDAAFFALSESASRVMDPQQRLALQGAYHALEDAGVVVDRRVAKKVGVYAGVSTNTYYQLVLDYIKQQGPDAVDSHTLIGNISNMVAAMVAHTFNFTGPAVAIDTACSSFHIALCQATQAIRSQAVDAALVIGANIMVNQDVHMLSKRAGIVSSTRYTKVFDEAADGSVLGEGIVVFYLESEAEAMAAYKTPYGVIRGIASNNDGSSLGAMAPNPAGQKAVIAAAYQDAGVPLSEVDYLEVHGTGTAIGDPIEMNVLATLFSQDMMAGKSIGVGSVKTNVGHLLSAAGGAGCAKALLCLYHQQWVASLHMKNINPNLRLEASPFYVVQENHAIANKASRRTIAGVSAFGLGGTNAHVVLAQAGQSAPKEGQLLCPILTLSAKTQRSLQRLKQSLQTMMSLGSPITWQSLCYTRNRHRAHYAYRAAAIWPSDSCFSQLQFVAGHSLSLRPLQIACHVTAGAWQSHHARNLEGADAFFMSHYQSLWRAMAGLIESYHGVIAEDDLLSFCSITTLLLLLRRAIKQPVALTAAGMTVACSQYAAGHWTLSQALQYLAASKQDVLVEPQAASLERVDVSITLGQSSHAIENTAVTSINTYDRYGDIPMSELLVQLFSELYVAGIDFDWSVLCPLGAGTVVKLPEYPFETRSHWIYSLKNKEKEVVVE